jgi:hypothetical protein
VRRQIVEGKCDLLRNRRDCTEESQQNIAEGDLHDSHDS